MWTWMAERIALRRTSAGARPTALLLPALLIVAACAAAAVAQEVPFVGIVEQDNVEVRAGAARTFYVVGYLKKGALVQVDKIIFGWHQIAAPPGIYSFISKAFVDVRGDGKSGTVNTDRADVKAASINGPGESYRRQIDLMRGDSVTLVSDEGSFYKIIPPQNAYVFVSPGAVRRASAAEIQAAGPKPAPTPAPQPAPTPEPAATGHSPSVAEVIRPSNATPPAPANANGNGPTKPAAAHEPDAEPAPVIKTPQAEPTVAAEVVPTPAVEAAGAVETPAAGGDAQEGFEIQPTSPAARAVDDRMKAAMKLPLEERPHDRLIADYEALLNDPSLPPADRQIINFRLAVLRRNQELARGLDQLRSAKQALDAGKTQMPQERTGPRAYSAVGRLLASATYDGKALPRMYRVVEPSNGRTLAYVRPNDVEAAAGRLGRIVGIEGPIAYDSTLKLMVVDVQHIDVLETAVPPAPTAEPTPAPAPEAAPASQ